MPVVQTEHPTRQRGQGPAKAGAWRPAKAPAAQAEGRGEPQATRKWAVSAELAEVERLWGVKPRAPRAKRGSRLQILLKQNDIGRPIGCGAGNPAFKRGAPAGGSRQLVGGGSADPPDRAAGEPRPGVRRETTDLWPANCEAI